MAGEMPQADTAEVAGLLREYAQRTALRGGNPYRAKAYSPAADSLSALAFPLDRLIEENRLTEIPGGGDAVAAALRIQRHTPFPPRPLQRRRNFNHGRRCAHYSRQDGARATRPAPA
jgi:DNA polymerase (family 10)